MKRIIIFVIFIAAILLFYPYLDDSEKPEPLTGLPWQIDVLPDGDTRVFGLTLAKSRLADAVVVLGDDMQLAIVAANDELGDLEMYYGNYRVGLLSGKLVLQTSTSEQNIKRWRDSAIKAEHMASGQAKKFVLSDSDMSLVLQEVITGITFIPAVNLDESIILARFGDPDERVLLEGVIHFVYLDKGLDIAMFEKAKEVIQYVSPKDFSFNRVNAHEEMK